MDKKEKKFLFDDPRNVKRLLRGFYGICIVLVGIDLVDLALRLSHTGHLRHIERSWEGLPGFYAIYGFVACVLLVVIAKKMRKLLMRKEDYYDK